MGQKTKVHAEDGKQEILITREFDLPLELLLKRMPSPNLLSSGWGRKC